MVFKDRKEAGQLLAEKLKNDSQIVKLKKDLVVVSLLRGGVLVGKEIAKAFNVPHIPLAVVKIPAPYNEELAIGAMCFDVLYFEDLMISSLCLNDELVQIQIRKTKQKFLSYIKRFRLEKIKYEKIMNNKHVVLVDDGIATGSTIKAANEFIRSQKAQSTILAAPVSPSDFDPSGFYMSFILYKDPDLTAISNYYEDFHQVTDEEVLSQ